MATADGIERFVRPFYKGKDTMHDLSHIQRILQSAAGLADHYPEADRGLLRLSAYFHGIVKDHAREVRKFLEAIPLPPDTVDRVICVAEESLKSSDPQSLEGKILHDAHLIEGGRTFLIAKCLITGAARGGSLEQIVQYIEANVLFRFRCCLPEAQRIYEERERFAAEFVADLKSSLAL